MTKGLQEENSSQIERIAEDALGTLSKIAEAARDKIRVGRELGADALAYVNTMTSGAAVSSLGQISRSNSDGYRELVEEPAIARILVADDEGEETAYYISRNAIVSGVSHFASYKSPVGRMASLPVGAEFRLLDGTVVEILEKTGLRPREQNDGWDSHDSVVVSKHFGPVTIESFRALLAKPPAAAATEDILSQLLAKASAEGNIIEGIRRSLITKMGLRDQPTLDQYQDEIFRLPLDKRLLILGPPGTGKTTTLIRRLGQKLDVQFLEDGEQRLVEALSTQGVPHSSSWHMFTPTELLKQYLKEAFGREGVATSDLRIKTWQDYRIELARSKFGILRTATGSGTFAPKDELPSLTPESLDRPIQWFDDFDTWQRNQYFQELQAAVTQLQESQVPDVQTLGTRLQGILNQAANGQLAAMFGSLAIELPKVQALVGDLKATTDKKLHEALNLQLNKDRGFLDSLGKFIDTLQSAASSEPDEEQDDDEDEQAPQKTPTEKIVAAYNQAARAQARSAANKRALSKSSRTGKIIEWLGDRGLAETERADVGTSLLLQTSARRFVNPIKRYLDGLPKRYRAFRRERQQDGRWYQKEGFEVRDIHPLELDIVLLAILRGAGGLLSRPGVLRDIDKPAWSSLKPVLDLYRHQILVDEATDFSPIQLACMAALAHPRLRSLFACGDFNQRLTTWGARSVDDMKWVFDDFDVKEVAVAYRQSRQLNDLARAIIRAVGGTEPNAGLPEHVNSEGVAPALLEQANDHATLIGWLADRIRDIERQLEQLPSIAVFVNTETDVEPLAGALGEALIGQSIPVMACLKGQAVGQDSNVRVFDIQHIKGLEFEAVFLVGIDQLATLHPALFDKYLYVGTTRAATYLGVTCQDTLPSAIESLRTHFCQDWQ